LVVCLYISSVPRFISSLLVGLKKDAEHRVVEERLQKEDRKVVVVVMVYRMWVGGWWWWGEV
jgi:hypothetical protein